MVVAPPVHVHVLVVQITFLLFAVVARVVPPVVWVGARVAPLHEHELPVVQELPRPRMQDKRRRNDFVSTEVGEAPGGRVTQQTFVVVHKKDSGIGNAAMPGTRGSRGRCPRKYRSFK